MPSIGIGSLRIENHEVRYTPTHSLVAFRRTVWYFTAPYENE